MAGPLPIDLTTLQPDLGMMMVVTKLLKQALTSNDTSQEGLIRTLLSKVVTSCNSVDVSTLTSSASGLPALVAEVISLVPNPATKLGSISLGMLGGSPRVRLAILSMMEDGSNALSVQSFLLHNKVLSLQGVGSFSILLHRMRSGDSVEIQMQWKRLLASELSNGVKTWHIASISVQSLGLLSRMVMGFLDVAKLTNVDDLKHLLITVPMRLSADPNNSSEYEGAEAIGELATKLWKNEEALHLVFTQLGAQSVKNLLGLAPFMRRIPMSLVKEASTKVVQNDALNDDIIIILGRNMIQWTTWPAPTQGSTSQINFWPATFVHALIAQKRVKVLVELVTTTSPQLLQTIETTADIAAMSVLKSLLTGYQSSPNAFHSILPTIPRVLETLAKVIPGNTKPTKHSIVSKWLRLLMSKLLFLFPEYPHLYVDLVKCLGGEENPLSKRERELLFESAWDGSRTVSFVWRYGAKEVFLVGLTDQGWEENGRKVMKKDDGSNWTRRDVCIWAQECNLDDTLFWNNNIDGKSLAGIDDAMLEKEFGLQNNLERANYLTQLKNISGEFFRVTVRLAPGSYEFKFLVDGAFKFDPELPKMKSGIGTINNTLTVAQISESSNTSTLQEGVPGKVGLTNLINTCYLNSVTQALFSTPMFQNELLRKGISAYSQKIQPYDGTSPMVACIDLFMTLKLTKRHFISPLRFLTRCRPPWCQAGTQQDSAEFLSYFFDQLEAASLKRIEIESKPTQVQLITTISEVLPSISPSLSTTPQIITIPTPPTTVAPPPTTATTTTTTTTAAAAIGVATPQPSPTTITTPTTPPMSTPTVSMSTTLSTSTTTTPTLTPTSTSPPTSTSASTSINTASSSPQYPDSTTTTNITQDANANMNTNMDTNTATNMDTNTATNMDTITATNTSTSTTTSTNTNTNTNTNANMKTNMHTNTATNKTTSTSTNTNTNTDMNTNMDTNTNASVNANPTTNTNTNANTTTDVITNGTQKQNKATEHQAEALVFDCPTHVFRGNMTTISTCLKCKNSSRRKDWFNVTTLAFDDDKNGLNENESVSGMLDRYLKVEKLSGDNKYQCDTCGLQDGSRQYEFTQLPSSMVFSLMRFSFDATLGTRKKLLNRVQLQPTIAVPYRVQNNGDETVRYETYSLTAIVVHSGPGINSGHYYTYATMGGEEAWYLYNDSTVTQQPSLDHILRQDSQFRQDTPYVLFYQRVADQARPENAVVEYNLATLPSQLRSSIERDIMALPKNSSEIDKENQDRKRKKQTQSSTPYSKPSQNPNHDEPPGGGGGFAGHMPRYIS